MTRITPILFGLFLALNSFAQTERIVESDISEVTVFKSGARVLRTAKFPLEQGRTQLFFTGISSKMNAESIQASLTGDVTIVSVTYELDYLDTIQKNAQIDTLTKALKELEASSVIYDMKSRVLSSERSAIIANSRLSSSEKISVQDIEDLANLYRNRLYEIDSLLLDLSLLNKQLDLQKIPLIKQLKDYRQEDYIPSVTVILDVTTKTSLEEVAVELYYNIGEAGWEAFYDARITDVNTDLGLSYNAKVFQNTGEDWKDVKLKLSTGDPKSTNAKPELKPFYLGASNSMHSDHSTVNSFKPVFSENMVSESAVSSIQGMILEEESGLSAIGATILVTQNGVSISGAVSDFDGNYEITDLEPGTYDVEVQYVGFMSSRTEGVQVGNGRTVNLDVSLMSDNEVLEEVAVVGYKVPLISADNTTSGATISSSEIARLPGTSGGSVTSRVSGVSVKGSRRNKSKYYLDGNRVSESRSEVNRQLSNVVFQVEDAYTIPTNNKPYDVHLLNYSIPADYSYFAIPKLREEAYLIANIMDWSEYDLLSGKVNIYFKGVYQGFSSINTEELGDTLSFSVGKDADILVQRRLDKEFSSKSFLGNYVKEQKAYTIAVRNNKPYPVNIVVKDQIPVSQRENIRVEDYEIGSASLDEINGEVTWKLNLQASEKKELILQYRVKYPKYTRLVLD
jgi:hypothetical protein